MARHRNVRSMNYAEEYDGFDDVYGHSVEDDYSISPSDAAYVFDRNTQKAQMSAFLAGDEDIAEEDEDAEEGVECVKRRDSDTLSLRSRNLSELDEARLRSCLDEIRNVIGDSMPEASLADIILANDFDVTKSLDAALSNAADESKKPPAKMKKQETPLPQREPRPHSSIDDNSSTMASIKEGIRTINLDKGVGLQKTDSSSTKPSFKVPKLFKSAADSDKENFNSSLKDSFNIRIGNFGNFENVQKADQSGNNVHTEDTTGVPSGLKSLNTPSRMQQPNKVPPLFRSVPQSGNSTDSDEDCSSLSALVAQHASKNLYPTNRVIPLSSKPDKIPCLLKEEPQASYKDDCVDSEEECSSLSALMAQHASKTVAPELTSLSALADFHLKGSGDKSNVQCKSEFVIPSLKLQPKPSKPDSEDCFSIEKLENSLGASNADIIDERDLDADNDGFVIDLLGALNPPDFRKQLERPSSRMNLDDIAGLHGRDEDEDFKPWIQDGSCILDARPFLSIDLQWERKLCSPVGRILCRRRVLRKVPYVRPSSPFIGDIVPFAFDTLSPDATIKKTLRRL